MNNDYLKYRDQAIKWLDSRRDFDEGVQILSQGGYKPVAVSNCIRRGPDSKFGREKLVALIYEFIRLWAKPSEAKHDDKPDLPYIQEPEPLSKDRIKTDYVDRAYPKDICRAMYEYYAMFAERRKLHAAAAAIPGNSDEEMKERNLIFDKVEKLSLRMSVLWAAKESYEKTGQYPDDLFAEKKKKEKQDPEEDDTISEDMTVEELKHKKKNIACQITRRKNLILYQSKTIQEKENPLPDGPKKLKYEREIAALNEQVTKIDYLIVEKENPAK